MAGRARKDRGDAAQEATATSFSGHESFTLRYGWPKKCVDAVAAQPDALSRDDAMVALGVGKNMVKAIRHWGLTARLVSPVDDAAGARRGELRVTPLGAALFGEEGADPYLEDPRTPWLLHWLLCTSPGRATTWAWAFGELDRRAFTRDELLRDLRAATVAGRATENTLGRDIDVFVRTYAPSKVERGAVEDSLDGPLVELRLLREEPAERRYEFVRGPKPTLDDVVFGYAVLDYWGRVAPELDTLSVDALARGRGSPGRVFQLDDGSLSERLEACARWSRGVLLHDETAGLRQLLRKRRVDPTRWLVDELTRARA